MIDPDQPQHFEPPDGMQHSCLGQLLVGMLPIVGFAVGFAAVAFVGAACWRGFVTW